jgi:hypothetical protein
VDHFYYWSRRFETQNRVPLPSGFIPIVSPKAKVDEEKLILLELQLPNQTRLVFNLAEARLLSFIKELSHATAVIR